MNNLIRLVPVHVTASAGVNPTVELNVLVAVLMSSFIIIAISSSNKFDHSAKANEPSRVVYEGEYIS